MHTEKTDQRSSKNRFIARGDELDKTNYPSLYNLSGAFFFRFIPRPLTPTKPEFLYLPVNGKTVSRLDKVGLLAQWNQAWESAQLRNRMFGEKLREYYPELQLNDETNVFLLPAKNDIENYLSLYMLMPLKTVQQHGLPPLKRMLWPSSYIFDYTNSGLPNDAMLKLAQAFSSQIWPFLNSGSRKTAFSKDEPLVLLSHNLDFWLPHVFSTIQDRLGSYPIVEPENQQDARALKKVQNQIPDNIWIDRCRMGGHAWLGEEEANLALSQVVERANKDGNLSNIIEAIRSNRVKEDFSDYWSYAKEDFERKIYNKRSKIKVQFVELDQADLIVGPHSDITEKILWQDFFAMLDRKERKVTICLARGDTSLTEIAKKLGYSNHSPVSKALKKIREKAKLLLS